MELNKKASIFTIAHFGTIEAFKEIFNEEEKNNKSENGTSLLQYAIAGSNFDIALFLLEKIDIDVNVTNKIGKTLLHYVAELQNIHVAIKLLEKGVDINIRDNYGNNAMWTAVFNCKGENYKMVELFIKYNPDILTKNKAGRSPLDFAYQVGNEKLIKILKEKNR